MACDPVTLARLIAEGDLGERARSELLARRHSALAKAIYPTLREFRAAVDDALFVLNAPDGTASAGPPVPVFEAA
jgi:hypothetical protein